ncbi:16S rRNA (cytidine(1402)-2'-O)-methyltransferase [Thiomicrorhabdus xiamenensis]|uniref:Ribosomal RNA small subunit methyltransferase I n=1 Tax=Thiomicrorhabdus xiamenensis TaxID=2739063 RepID=A0A7D4P6D0_9GAMM|nr:16S rRNA (cytidine(1402)-2'-O)-methyltransferase [Thiomicrorhabdus xiamenensis]
MSSNELQPGSGTLYVVATPIGNLQDITHRALDVLAAVDWVAAEDTRHTRPLLQNFAINQNLISLHEHNESERSEQLLQRLLAGENGALVSDAGTPLINDPGYVLVKRLRQAGVAVVPVPGASAVITALSAAGLPTDRFTYEGFLPAKSSKRLQQLTLLVEEPRTLVFYESPHRLLDSLADMAQVFGEARQIVVARELSKQFEQFVSGEFHEVVEYFSANRDKVRGEFVLMVQGFEQTSQSSQQSDYDPLIKTLMKQKLPVKQISEIVADYFSVKKKAVYQRVLELKDA